MTRNNIEDDKLGIFKPIFAEMGNFARRHPEELVFDLLRRGFDTPGFDGSNFFSESHRLKGQDGEEVTVSNMQTGSGQPWFLLDTSRAIRPIIWQERSSYEFQALTEGNNPHVFLNDQYLYGVRAWVNAGFDLWQLAYASKAALDTSNYAAARAAMQDFRNDGGRVLGVKPTILVVPPALEAAALQILNATHAANGESNIWQGTAQLIVTPYVEG